MNRCLLIPLLLAACAPSPLFVDAAPIGPEVPRDGRGNPILSAVRTPPADAAPRR